MSRFSGPDPEIFHAALILSGPNVTGCPRKRLMFGNVYIMAQPLEIKSFGFFFFIIYGYFKVGNYVDNEHCDFYVI